MLVFSVALYAFFIPPNGAFRYIMMVNRYTAISELSKQNFKISMSRTPAATEAATIR